MPSDDHPVLFRRAGNRINRRGVRAFANVLREELAQGKRFTCLITDDGELRRLNRRFLGHDYPTDVPSFPSGSDADLGEIAISSERAAEQARRLFHGIDEEVHILMLHGVLHLLGMDHASDKGAMARTEKRWREKLALPPSLLER